MRRRRGFSLLEVMVALAILAMVLVVLMEIQTTGMVMTQEAERIISGTQLANEKLTEVMLYVESEGFTSQDKCENGDFDDFGDEAIDLEFGEALEDYHYEWCIREIDIGLAGDIASMASGLTGSGYLQSSDAATDAAGAAGMGAGAPDLSSFGVSNQMITEMLGRYVREVRVRVWWGEDSDKAEENNDQIVLISHAINPTGAVAETGQGMPAEGGEP